MKNKTHTKLKGQRLLPAAPLLGAKEMCRLIALTRWVTQAQMALQRNLIRLEHRYGSLAKWFVIERVAARGANRRLLVKPTKTTRDLLAAGLACVKTNVVSSKLPGRNTFSISCGVISMQHLTSKLRHDRPEGDSRRSQ